MSFDEITRQRIALFHEGGIRLDDVSTARRLASYTMLPIDPLDVAATARALEYNRLAAVHRTMTPSR